MRIRLVQADDWSGVYIDGELKLEDHYIDVEDILEVIGADYTAEEPAEEQYTYLEQTGRFPHSEEEWLKLKEDKK